MEGFLETSYVQITYKDGVHSSTTIEQIFLVCSDVAKQLINTMII